MGTVHGEHSSLTPRPDDPLVGLAPSSSSDLSAHPIGRRGGGAEQQAMALTLPLALFFGGFSCFGSTFPFAMLNVTCESLYPADRCAAHAHTAAGALSLAERAHFNAAAARWSVMLTMCAFGPTVLSVSFLMSRSEVVGRKPVLLFAMLTAALLYSSTAAWYAMGLPNAVLVPAFLD